MGSTDNSEHKDLESRHAAKSEELKQHISIKTNLTDNQTNFETYGTGKPEKITVSKTPQEVIETGSISLLEQNQNVNEEKNEKRNAKLNLEALHDRPYTVHEMKTDEKEEQFEQKQPKQEKAKKNKDSKPKNVVTKKKTH